MALSKETDLAKMSKEDLIIRLNKLEGEIESLKEDCSAAGELGIQLIQNNNDLREQLEKEALEYQEQITVSHKINLFIKIGVWH